MTDAGSIDGSARAAAALEAIGWRGANGLTPEELAPDVAAVVASVRRGGSGLAAIESLAALLHGAAAPLDGSMYPPSAFEPAATELLARLTRGDA